MKPYEHKVQYYETDKMGIVHHSNYIRWMEEARVDFLEQIGWNFDRLEAEGIGSPVTALNGKYKVSTKFPEVVTIIAFVEEFKGVKLKIRYEMKNTKGEMVFEGHSEHCFVNSQGRIVRLKEDFPGFYEILTELAENK